jgi:chorismate mutase-like protein
VPVTFRFGWNSDAQIANVPNVDLPDLVPLRAEIDVVDREISSLLRRRLELVYQVGEVKRLCGAKIHDPERERAMLQRLGDNAQAPLEADMVRRVFKCIIEESRALEEKHVAATP